jgi:putative inorganic carbon (HCO3(-)) transporter
MPAALTRAVDEAPKVLLPLLLVTLPLEFTQKFFPVREIQLGRLVIGLCVVVLFLQALLRTRELALPPLRAWLPALAFTAYAAASALVTFSSGGLKTVAAMVTYGVLALAVYNWTRSRPGQDRFWMWLAISVIGVAIVGLVEYMTGTYIWNAPAAGFWRINSTFKDPNIYARFLTIGVVTAVILASRSGARWRGLFIATVVVGSAALPFTFSRQGWVLGGAVLALAVVLAPRRLPALGLAALAVAIFAGIVTLDPDVQRRLNHFEQFVTAPRLRLFDSPLLAWINLLPIDGIRHYLIAAGFQMFYDHPIFGVGFGNFQANMLGAYHAFILPGFDTLDSHTSFVTILAEQGLVGVALVGWWAFELVRATVRSARSGGDLVPYVIAGAMALLLIVLQSQVEGRLLTEPYGWLFIGAVLAAARGSEDRRDQAAARAA